METLYDQNREQMESWLSPFINYSYVLLHAEADPLALEAKLPALIEKYVGEDLRGFGVELELFLQPLTRIHLHSDLRHELAPNSDIAYVYTFAFVAAAVLLIACFNFMNLATARWTTRSREVGVRKVLGAHRAELIRQFLVESMLYSLLALGIALVLVHLALPFVGDLLAADSVARAEGIDSMVERTLSIDYLEMPWLFPAFLGLALAIGLIAGSYPALFLASFDPARTLHGGWNSVRGNTSFRRVLVTVQFAISIALTISTVTVVRQLQHLREVRLGFDKHHVVVVPVMDEAVRDSIPAIREEFEQLGPIVTVGASSHVPGGRPSGGSYAPEGYPEGETEMMDRVTIDEGYLETLGITVVAGRGFTTEFTADEAESVLINEAAARKLGWDDPLGKTIRPAGADDARTVVGVVRDFHFSSPHRRIGPMFINKRPAGLRALFLRISPDNVPATLDLLRERWRYISTNPPPAAFARASCTARPMPNSSENSVTNLYSQKILMNAHAATSAPLASAPPIGPSMSTNGRAKSWMFTQKMPRIAKPRSTSRAAMR